jgi:hypothetical protein
MIKRRKLIPRIAFGAVLTVICYCIMNMFIIETPVWKFILIDVLFAVAYRIKNGFEKKIGFSAEEVAIDEIEE